MQKTVVNGPEVGENESSRTGAPTPETALTTPADRSSDDMAKSKSTPRSPAFQFYPNDFLSDANVIAMSLQERGAYITLLCLCWQQGALPNNVDRLARMCGVPVFFFRKLWPSLSPCFRVVSNDRLTHPRLERERQKQDDFRRKQSEKGKASAASRKATEGQPEVNRGSNPVATEQQPNGNSSIYSLQSSSSSSDFSQKADARSKHPVFKGRRFVVFEWMLDDLSRMLGSHANAFDLHAWFYELDEQADSAGVVVPQRDGGKWLQERTQAEAIRRGLPLASSPTHNPKTAGNLAAAARFVARGQK